MTLNNLLLGLAIAICQITPNLNDLKKHIHFLISHDSVGWLGSDGWLCHMGMCQLGLQSPGAHLNWTPKVHSFMGRQCWLSSGISDGIACFSAGSHWGWGCWGTMCWEIWVGLVTSLLPVYSYSSLLSSSPVKWGWCRFPRAMWRRMWKGRLMKALGKAGGLWWWWCWCVCTLLRTGSAGISKEGEGALSSFATPAWALMCQWEGD